MPMYDGNWTARAGPRRGGATDIAPLPGLIQGNPMGWQGSGSDRSGDFSGSLPAGRSGLERAVAALVAALVVGGVAGDGPCI